MSESAQNEERPLRPAERLSDLIPEEQAAELLHVSKNHLHELRTRDEHPLPYVRMGKAVFYIEQQLVDWLNDHQKITLPIEERRRRVMREAVRRAKQRRSLK